MKHTLKQFTHAFVIIAFIFIFKPGFALADGNDTYTKLLLHLDGPEGSVTASDYIDSSASAHTIGRAGEATFKYAVNKFGPSSIYFDGLGDYLTANDNNDFDFGNGNFTIDWWEYRTDAGSGKPAIMRDSGGNFTPFMLGISGSSNNLFGNFSTNGTSMTSQGANMGSLTVNTWVHFAVTRSANTTRFFRNGVQTDATSTLSSALPDSTLPLSIGWWHTSANGDYYYQGYMDEIRISKGIARWTANFTPSTFLYGGSYPIAGSNWSLCTVSGVSGNGTVYPVPTVNWTFSALQSTYNDGVAPPSNPNPVLSTATQRSYYLQIDNNINFGSPEINTSASSTVNQYTVAQAGLSFNNNYYWRLKTYDNYGTYNDWLSDNTHAIRTEIEIPTCTAVADSASQITITSSNVTNLSVSNSGLYFNCSAGINCNTGLNTWINGGLSDSSTSLTEGTLYSFQVKARNASSTETSYGLACSATTLSNGPAAPILSLPTATTITANPISGGSESGLAIYVELGGTCDGSGGLGYVQADGSIGPSVKWQTDTEWRSIIVTGLTPVTQYSFCVKAKNVDNSETFFGLAASMYTNNGDYSYPSILLQGGIYLNGGIKFK